MTGVQQGNKDAFKELIRPCCQSIYQRALTATGDCNKAREITANVLREVYLAVCAQRSEAEWSAWVDDVATRHIMKQELACMVERTKNRGSAERPNLYNERLKEGTASDRKKTEKKPSRGSVGGTIGIVLCVLIALWMIFGFAFAKTDWAAGIDLGYSWFNQNIFQLFAA